MPDTPCQALPEQSPLEAARHLILKVLGVRRVADWCGVTEMAVYQWLQRGTDEKPIPRTHVLTIVAKARAEGLDAPMAILWPAMAGVSL